MLVRRVGTSTAGLPTSVSTHSSCTWWIFRTHFEYKRMPQSENFWVRLAQIIYVSTVLQFFIPGFSSPWIPVVSETVRKRLDRCVSGCSRWRIPCTPWPAALRRVGNKNFRSNKFSKMEHQVKQLSTLGQTLVDKC